MAAPTSFDPSGRLDELTGVGSRSASLAEIRWRVGRGDALHCIVVDIDDFNMINDQLGTAAADDLLCQVADRLGEALPDAFIGRLGADEFIALRERRVDEWTEGEITTIDVSTSTGSRVVQLSVGVTSTSMSGNDADELLADAQAALRLAKSHGKQRVVWADEHLRRTERHRREIAHDVREALEDNALVAWGQPIFDLVSGDPAGIELLARWPRAGGKFEPPDVFIPIVESLGFSFLLGEFMIREAVDVLRHLDELGDTSSFVTVNVSALHIAEPLLPSLIGVQLDLHQIAPRRLIVELTESQRLPDSCAGRQAVDRLLALGVGVASDDLGAGWSSLTQMIHERFTHVKTDRELIRATARIGGTELIRGIRTLAEGAGQIPIAEGIESADELAAARAAGFPLGQGWHLGQPAPLEAVLSLFDDTPLRGTRP